MLSQVQTSADGAGMRFCELFLLVVVRSTKCLRFASLPFLACGSLGCFLIETRLDEQALWLRLVTLHFLCLLVKIVFLQLCEGVCGHAIGTKLVRIQ